MMEWRELLYSFGLIANVLFALRFTLQWIGSELKQKSDLPAYFWRISLSANSIMYIHTLIQLQLNVCLIQAVNAILSWRNLDFMKPKGEQAQFKTVVILLLGSVAATFLLFILQGYYLLDGNYIFIRGFGSKDEALGPAWHLFGTFGFTLFSSRFWLQWWQSEQAQESTVNPSFWWRP
ncbi:MAG: lipid-A-disaccharide synthase N-terminal domain-containing protein, partial [Chlamydiia bacterium]|nr:lipid-A-disaccharide synthase N-terminal domain-containing protein [Chlamydiia bacterium]